MPDNRKEQRGMKTFINSGKNKITDLVIKFALKSPYVACARLEQSYVVHGGNDRYRNRSRWIIHHTNHEKYSGGLERAAETLRLPGKVIAETAWRQELSCRLFLRLQGACRGGYFF